MAKLNEKVKESLSKNGGEETVERLEKHLDKHPGKKLSFKTERRVITGKTKEEVIAELRSQSKPCEDC